jgi:hypothetical protein
VELAGTVIYAMFFQCFNLLLGGLILVQTFICILMTMFSSYQVTRDSSGMMENRSHASIHGIDMVDLKLTLKKIV